MLKLHGKTIFEALGRNPIHPFPARMAPGIALDVLAGQGKKLRVLDPMVGSGTVVAVARANGHHAIGVDIDPLAVLLAKVWTTSLDVESINATARQVLEKSKMRFKTLKSASAYPETADEETRKFTRFWFDDYARRQLAALATSIEEITDLTTRDVLWCGLSRLIITKTAGASLAMDLSHSRPHRRYRLAPVKPFNRFVQAVATVTANCQPLNSKDDFPPAVVQQGDARALTLADYSIDLAITSPPYLNAIDYMRCSKFSLVWMGHRICDLRRVRGSSVGAEARSYVASGMAWIGDIVNELGLSPQLSPKNREILGRYILDMRDSVAEVARVLRAGGRAVYVVGDSMVRGTFVENSRVVERVAGQCGLVLESKHSRELPPNRRYMPPPKTERLGASMDNRMRNEVVLVFDKARPLTLRPSA